MKKKLLVAVITVLVLAISFGACSNKPVFKTVEASRATAIATKKNTIILDVRTPSEYAEGHLPKAVNIDFLDASFSDRIGKLDKKKKYLVYCKSGHRSTQAVELMKQHNFRNVTNMLGGITQWPGSIIK